MDKKSPAQPAGLKHATQSTAKLQNPQQHPFAYCIYTSIQQMFLHCNQIPVMHNSVLSATVGCYAACTSLCTSASARPRAHGVCCFYATAPTCASRSNMKLLRDAVLLAHLTQHRYRHASCCAAVCLCLLCVHVFIIAALILQSTVLMQQILGVCNH